MANLRLVLDLGKSGSRGLVEGGSAAWAGAGLPADRAAGPDAADLLLGRVLEGVAALASLSLGAEQGVASLVVGSTFLPPLVARREVAERLTAALPGAGITLLEDGVLAHAGALGRPGVVASVGTGVVVFGVDSDGVRKVDGWGPEWGDRGGAVDLGRRGLAAACLARDGAGPPTTLADAAERYLGRSLDHDAAASLLADPDRIVRLGGFAVEVAGAASGGDPVAVGLVEAAAARVARSCVAALGDGRGLPVAVVGRLAGLPACADALARALARAGLGQVEPEGGPLDAGWDIVSRSPYAAAAWFRVEGSP